MSKPDFIKTLRENDNHAYNAIVELFKTKGITELDVSNPDDEYDDIQVYCFDDDCLCANNIKIHRIRLTEKGNLNFLDENNIPYSTHEFHSGSLPYIYNIVDWITSDMPDVDTRKKYEVQIYYHGCFSTTVEANDEDEAVEIVREQANSLPDLDFLDAIELMEDGHDVFQFPNHLSNK